MFLLSKGRKDMILDTSRFSCILFFASISHTHDFYYAQQLIEQVTLDNFNDSWNRSLQKTLSDLYAGPLHKRRILQILDEKIDEFRALKRINSEEFAFVYQGFIVASHCINVLLTHRENILNPIPTTEMCYDDLIIPGAVLDSYRQRKNIINSGSRLLSIPIWFYWLKYIHLHNNKIEHAIKKINSFYGSLIDITNN